MNIRKTMMFCEDQTTANAIVEYSLQKGYMTACNCDDGSHFHFSDMVRSADLIIMEMKEEGLLIFYENEGTCYRLTQKGEDWYRGLQNKAINLAR